MLGSLGWQELAIVLVIVLILFGVGRVSGLGRELGSSIKEFRKAVKDEDAENENERIRYDSRSEDDQAATSAPSRPTEPKQTQSSGETKPPSVF